MITWKIKLWRHVGAAAMLTAAAACGQPVATSAPAAEPPPPAGASGESGGGGEQGEAGVAEAFDGLSGDARLALHLQHLKGFLLIADRMNSENHPEEAGVLVGQGVLEGYEEKAADFGAFDVSKLRAASDGSAKTSAQLAPKIHDAEAVVDAARAHLSVNHADLAARMIDISTGLYQNVNQSDFVDPTEYQHSLGAALSAKDALVAGRDAMRRQNARAYDEAAAEIDRFIALWPQSTAPDHPTAYRDVVRQASRVRLALSPFLDATD